MDGLRTGKAPVLSIGIIVFAVGVAFFITLWMTQHGGIPAKATITSMEEKSEIDSLGNKKFYYHAHLSFVIQSGDTISTYLYTNSRKEYSVGQSLEIVYQLDNPNRVYRNKSFLWYFLFVAIALVGIAIIYASAKMKSEKWEFI